MTANSDSTLSELRQTLRSHWKTFAYVGGFSLFINLLMLAPPLYMLQIYDRVLTSRSEETLVILTLVILWLFVTMGALEFVRSRILVRMSSRLDAALSERLYGAMTQLALRQPDRLTSQPLTDLMNIRQFMSGNGPFAFFDTPWVPIYIAILFFFDPYFGWFALFAATVISALALLNEFTTRKLQQRASGEHNKASTLAEAQLRNAEAIHAMGMQQTLRERWLRNHLQGVKAQSEAADRAGVWLNLSKTLRLLFQSLMLGLGAYLAIESRITAGMVIAGSILMGRALAPIDQLIASWKPFVNSRAAFFRLDALLSQIPEEKARLSLPSPKGNLAVESAVLVPPGGKTPVLKGVSLFLRAGEMLAVIGPSAAGKSSLVRAILGVWPLNMGKVRLDSSEIGHWNREELGPHIGYLPQDIELFDGTVAENIARFGAVDHKKIIQAARIAGIDKMIRHLPSGYDTAIGTNGIALSAGQRQRIALARAVYGRPKLILLDEPNSNLDEAGEAALRRACNYLKSKGVTLILVSHRKQILKLADKILVLEAGQMKLFGPRDAVLERVMPTLVRPRLVKPPAEIAPLPKQHSL